MFFCTVPLSGAPNGLSVTTRVETKKSPLWEGAVTEGDWGRESVIFETLTITAAFSPSVSAAPSQLPLRGSLWMRRLSGCPPNGLSVTTRVESRIARRGIPV